MQTPPLTFWNDSDTSQTSIGINYISENMEIDWEYSILRMPMRFQDFHFKRSYRHLSQFHITLIFFFFSLIISTATHWLCWVRYSPLITRVCSTLALNDNGLSYRQYSTIFGYSEIKWWVIYLLFIWFLIVLWFYFYSFNLLICLIKAASISILFLPFISPVFMAPAVKWCEISA